MKKLLLLLAVAMVLGGCETRSVREDAVAACIAQGGVPIIDGQYILTRCDIPNSDLHVRERIQDAVDFQTTRINIMLLEEKGYTFTMSGREFTAKVVSTHN